LAEPVAPAGRLARLRRAGVSPVVVAEAPSGNGEISPVPEKEVVDSPDGDEQVAAAPAGEAKRNDPAARREARRKRRRTRPHGRAR
jgi:hypothetical protein